ANSGKAAALLRRVAPALATHPSPCPRGCDRVLDAAIVTAPEARDREAVARLDAVAGRVMSRES
ncbi:MAG: 5-methylthioadenosine phosphorylase, partial [Gemmatimonadetes bacterium]|nr:5-methylthioadenosine phosphorylase [Gemmatimonadota bacterium]